MGHPHPTVDLPGLVPALADELRAVWIPDALSERLIELVTDAADDAGGDHPPDAHVCATAWVLSDDASRILLADHDTLGWSTPGGHLHQGETSRDAALRELNEESGIDSATLAQVGRGPALVHFTDVGGARPHRHWNIGWLFVADEEISARAEFFGYEQVAWWPCAELPEGAPDLPSTVARLLARAPITRRNR